PGYAVQRVQPLGPLAAITTALLCVIAVICALCTAVALHRAGMLEQFLDGTFNGSWADLEDKFDDSEAELTALQMAFWVLLSATAGTFISWQYRHARNAEALG